LKEADAVFLASMDEEYHGNRGKASTAMAMRGWQYLSQGDLEDAMRRFNQAWLLDKADGTALWGMAAVEASTAKWDESLELFAEANRLIGDNVNFSVDYAKALGMAGAARKEDKLLKDAYVRFQHIYDKTPGNALNLQNWAMTLFQAGRYPEAWQKVKLAEALPNKGNLDPRFIAALQSRMARPD